MEGERGQVDSVVSLEQKVSLPLISVLFFFQDDFGVKKLICGHNLLNLTNIAPNLNNLFHDNRVMVLKTAPILSGRYLTRQIGAPEDYGKLLE